MEQNWNQQAKRLLKSELVRRGISNAELVYLLKDIGVEETKASIDSKISRGTFSAAFFLQCLNAIGCTSFDPVLEASHSVQAARVNYQKIKSIENAAN